MKFNSFYLLLLGLLLLSACSSTKNKIFWVSGTKSECTAGVGKMQCLQVHKGKDLSEAKWEHFYAKIEGFEFEEGFLKKIEVKEKKLDPKNVPADGSSIQYTLVKELDKQADQQVLIGGKWTLARFNDSPINRSIVLPTMELTLNPRRISGSGGCNRYSGEIAQLSQNNIQFGQMVSTKKACANKNIESDYLQALSKVQTYQMKGKMLAFYEESGKEVLAYIPKKEKKANPILHDIWITTHINGNPMEQQKNNPRLEINLTQNKIFGNDGCNNYSGSIKEVSDSKIMFSAIAATKKMCPNMEVTNPFNQAMRKVVAYKLDGLKLSLIDQSGQEVLTFLKGD